MPRRQRGGIALTVALKRAPALVVLPAVELDYHALVGEQHVDLVAGHVGVDLRLGEAGTAREGREVVLEPRPGGPGRDRGESRQAVELLALEMTLQARIVDGTGALALRQPGARYR